MARLKLDLHMHPEEMSSFAPLTVAVVENVLENAMDHGLDGIAITEHENLVYGLKFVELVQEHFSHYPLLVLPGREIKVKYHEEVEVYLPEGKIFRFLAHPATTIEFNGNMGGIEVENSMHYISRRHVEEMLAASPHLLALRNSDAHHYEDVGKLFSELAWEDLVARAK